MAEKIIQLDEEEKVLILEEKHPIRTEIFIPDLWIDKKNYGGFFTQLFTSYGLEEECEFLCSCKRIEPHFVELNHHLKKYTFQKAKHYYVRRKPLSKEQIRQIMDFCYENNFIPEFMDIGELVTILESADFLNHKMLQGKEKLPLYYDTDLVKVLKKVPNKKILWKE